MGGAAWTDLTDADKALEAILLREEQAFTKQVSEPGRAKELFAAAEAVSGAATEDQRKAAMEAAAKRAAEEAEECDIKSMFQTTLNKEDYELVLRTEDFEKNAKEMWKEAAVAGMGFPQFAEVYLSAIKQAAGNDSAS